MSACPRCGREVKDISAHLVRMHPEAMYMHTSDAKPHSQARRVTLEDFTSSHEGYGVYWDEWHTERYGFRQHGWFIPVDVADNQEPRESSDGEYDRSGAP